MAVPKKKTTPSKRGMRNSGKSLKPINIMHDERGTLHRSHHVSEDGYYNGKLVIRKKKEEKNS